MIEIQYASSYDSIDAMTLTVMWKHEGEGFAVLVGRLSGEPKASCWAFQVPVSHSTCRSRQSSIELALRRPR